jgi:predicted nucleotidyltransferase
MQPDDFFLTLRALADAHVDFILVGGLAAVVNGAPINTFDVDVVHSRDPTNISCLMPVLESLDAIYRIQPARRLKPTESYLASPGHQNLLTRHGPLDLLGTIGSNLAYEDLLPHSVEMDIGEGVHVRVLDLETLIAIKEELGGEKDRAVLPILRRTLEEKKKLEGS